jgi:hypothetical protein
MARTVQPWVQTQIYSHPSRSHIHISVLGGEQPPKRNEGSDASDGVDKTPLDYAEVFATLSYWYHLPYSEIRNMPHSAIKLYMDKLTKNHAALRLMLGEAAQVPGRDEDGLRTWVKDIDEKLNGKRENIPAPLAVLKMVGIGVRK